MNSKVIQFRNLAAEIGIELTPQQAEKFYACYDEFKAALQEAFETCPDFLSIVSNCTTEEKLEMIKQLEYDTGEKMSIREFNEITQIVNYVCKIEGYS